MKTEKVVISFFAVTIGIIVSALAFYLYQTTKVVPVKQTKTTSISLAPNEKDKTQSFFLTLDNPKEETVSTVKTVTVSGKTSPSATIVILTEYNDQVMQPAKNGNFSTTVNIDDLENYIEILAIAPNGDEIKELRTVTYSSENF